MTFNTEKTFMKSCLPQYHADAVVICLFTQWLLTSKVCWSSWLVTHPDSTQESGKGGGAKFVLRIIKTTNSPSFPCFCDFSKLSARPGSPRLSPTVTSSVRHQYGWDLRRREKSETFPKYQSASGSAGNYAWCAPVICVLYSSLGKWIMIPCLWVA